MSVIPGRALSPGEQRVLPRALLGALLLCGPVLAHEGHDHEETAAAAAVAAPAGQGVVELVSETYEAVVESHGDHLDIWLDLYATNEPVTGARVSVAVGDADGKLAAEESPGQYMVEIEPLPPGSSVPVTLTLRAAAGDDLLGGTLEVPATEAVDVASRLQAWVAAGWRWALGLAVLAGLALLLQRRRASGRPGWGGSPPVLAAALPGAALLAAALVLSSLGAAPVDAHEGHDHAEEAPASLAAAPVAPGMVRSRPARLPDGSVFVPKPTQRILELRTQVATSGPMALAQRLAGEIVGDPRASAALQTLQGGRVSGAAGQWPVLGARVRRGQPLFRIAASGSGDERAATAAEAARAAAELVAAEAELARLEGLAGVVARAEVDVARSRVAGLRSQLSALRAPLAADGELVVAPIDGLIASIDARPGTVVAPGETLLTLIDPARLSIDALAFDPVVAAEVVRASIRLRDGTALEARLVGVGAQLRGGATPVRLDLPKVAPGLAVGEPVTVFLERSLTAPGLGLPLDALVRLPSGERVLYEKVAAERFVPRTVRVRQVSADRIAVLDGLGPDARVVVRGAALIGQIR